MAVLIDTNILLRVRDTGNVAHSDCVQILKSYGP